MNLETIIGHVGGRCRGQFDEQDAWKDARASSSEVKAAIGVHFEKMLSFVEKKNDSRSFDEVERGVRDYVFAFGRLLLTSFVTQREEQSKKSLGNWQQRVFAREIPNESFSTPSSGESPCGAVACAGQAARGFRARSAMARLQDFLDSPNIMGHAEKGAKGSPVRIEY